jgi:hypothetical protein
MLVAKKANMGCVSAFQACLKVKALAAKKRETVPFRLFPIQI